MEKLSKVTIGKQATRSIKAPMSPNESQKTTTAPSVKAPGYSFVKDIKVRTARESAVDAWNRENPSHSGGKQYETMIMRQKAEMIKGDSHSASASVLAGRPKQAQ